MLHSALRENKSELRTSKYSESVAVPRAQPKVLRTNLHAYTPLHETNTLAPRIHTVYFAS